MGSMTIPGRIFLWIQRRCVFPHSVRARDEMRLRARQSVCAMPGGRLFSLAAVSIFLGRIANLQSFAEAFSIPVAQTLSGKGAIPCIHPLSVGLFGRWSRIANDLIASCRLYSVGWMQDGRDRDETL